MALSAEPSGSIIATTVKVEVVDDSSDCLFKGFELGVGTVKIVYVKVEGGTR